MGFLHRLRRNVQSLHLVELTGKVGPLAGQELLQQLHRLLQASEADVKSVEGNAGLLVLLLQPAGADAELQASLREDVDRVGGHRQYDRMAKVVVEEKAGQF